MTSLTTTITGVERGDDDRRRDVNRGDDLDFEDDERRRSAGDGLKGEFSFSAGLPSNFRYANFRLSAIAMMEA